MRDLRPCGTQAAWARHRRKGEEPCEACKQANRDHVREWVLRNPDKVRANQKRWADKHRDKERVRNRARYAANIDKERERSRKKRLERPDMVRSTWQKHSYGISLEEKRALFVLQGERCALGVACNGAPMSFDKMATDHCHVIGGRDGRSVRGVCCPSCNKLFGFVGDSLDGIHAFRSKLDTFERYLTHTFPETQRRLAEIRARKP